MDGDRLEIVQAQRYCLADCKQDLQRSQSLLCLEAEEGMVDVRSMADDYLSSLAEVCDRDCHCKATVQVAKKPYISYGA